MIQMISTAIVLLFGIAISLSCLYGLAKPVEMIDGVIHLWHNPSGMTAAVVSRVLLGLCLIFAAAGSRFPPTFQVLGAIALLTAAIIMLAGKTRVDRLIVWISKTPPIFIRLWLVLGGLFGLFVVYATV